MEDFKRLFTFLLAGLLFTFLATPQTFAQSPATYGEGDEGEVEYSYFGLRQQIEEFVLEFYEASTLGDIEAMERLISRSPNALFFGTDPSEVFVGHDEIIAWWQGIFDALDSLGYPNNGGLPIVSTGSPVQVGHRGSVVWVADEPTFEFLNGETPVRLTLVVRREWGRWKIVQGPFSVGVPNNELPV